MLRYSIARERPKFDDVCDHLDDSANPCPVCEASVGLARVMAVLPDPLAKPTRVG